MNLILILFDVRDSSKFNVVEVMMMARTVMQGFSKMYPNVKFFKNEAVIQEIRPSIMTLFTDYIEQEIERQQQELSKQVTLQQRSSSSVNRAFDERASSILLSKQAGKSPLRQSNQFGQTKPQRRGSDVNEKDLQSWQGQEETLL